MNSYFVTGARSLSISSRNVSYDELNSPIMSGRSGRSSLIANDPKLSHEVQCKSCAICMLYCFSSS